MIIVPDLETVFILVPRTGSGTLYRELKRVYPRSMLLYRHMEATGVPFGYDRWMRVGFTRHPLCRMWSLYNYLRETGGGGKDHDKEVQRRAVDRPFESWLLGNDVPFSTSFNPSPLGSRYCHPWLARHDTQPENKKSAWAYLRPDLGTHVLHFSRLRRWLAKWGLDENVVRNESNAGDPPRTRDIQDHLSTYFRWDLEQDCEER